MTELGEWASAPPPTPTRPHQPAAPATTGPAGGGGLPQSYRRAVLSGPGPDDSVAGEDPVSSWTAPTPPGPDTAPAAGAVLDAAGLDALQRAVRRHLGQAGDGEDLVDEQSVAALTAAAADAVHDVLTATTAPAQAPAAPQAPAGGDPDAPGLYYANLEEFITEFLAPTYGRSLIGGRLWCPSWWLHIEAVYRLDGLWRSWEFLRLDAATGASVWMRDHADHHMSMLMSDAGPFKGCSPAKGHREPEPQDDWSVLPLEPAPPGLFDLD